MTDIHVRFNTGFVLKNETPSKNAPLNTAPVALVVFRVPTEMAQDHCAQEFEDGCGLLGGSAPTNSSSSVVPSGQTATLSGGAISGSGYTQAADGGVALSIRVMDNQLDQTMATLKDKSRWTVHTNSQGKWVCSAAS